MNFSNRTKTDHKLLNQQNMKSIPVLEPILQFDSNDESECEVEKELKKNFSNVYDDVDGNGTSKCDNGQYGDHNDHNDRKTDDNTGNNDNNQYNNECMQMCNSMQRRAPTFLIIEALIWCFCGYHESDRNKQKQLYLLLCQRLEHLKIIGSSYKSESFQHIRELIVFKMRQTLTSCGTTIPSFNSNTEPHYSPFSNTYNRYKDEFHDLGLIEEGGFGVVKMAKHVFDNCNYAVKLIRFRYKNMSAFKKITREVELYANLSSHPNVVGYKTAWLENWCSQDIKDLNSKLEERKKEEMTSASNQKRNISKNVDNDVSIRFEESSKSSIRIERSKKLINNSIIKENNKPINELSEDEENENMNSYSELSEEALSCSSSTDLGHQSKKYKNSISKCLSDSVIKYGHCNKTANNNSQSQTNMNFSEEKKDYSLSSLQFGAVLYIQMELCGKNLRTWLRERNDKIFKNHVSSGDNDLTLEIDEKQSLHIFRQVLKGVEFIHSRHLIHRDLKPQNILFSLDETNKVKIGDFGLATLHNSIDNEEISLHSHNFKRTRTLSESDNHTRGLGTSIYAAPEQKLGSTYDNKADMYSIGIILFELFYPLSTEMEKVKCVCDIAQKRILPKSLAKRRPCVAEMILNLTNEDPDVRPNTHQVLDSFLYLNKEQQLIKSLEEKLERKERETSKLIAIINSRDQEIITKDKEIMRLRQQIQRFTQ